MPRQGKRIDYHEHDTPKAEKFPDNANVVSAQECTGLMYRTPQTGDEWESLQQLSPMGIPVVKEPMDRKIYPRYAGQSSRKNSPAAHDR